MRRFTMRDVLLAVQIAICAVLVTSSLVAVRGLARSMHSNFGFDPAECDAGRRATCTWRATPTSAFRRCSGACSMRQRPFPA
jgi:hypothetical protein